jgi:mediator of RNA polymerase II transcription subunit 14
LTAKEILKSLEDLNTLLAIRINLHEYHKIPYHFRDYTIQSGRVTFRVAGEFEVDLTIGDEDPEKQFWFIDLRFLFSPAPAELSERIRDGLYHRLNKILEDEGLAGCYKFLHEFTLTHKITELRRQAVDLARGTWIETLKVEPLHRSLSIQYWVDRYGKDGPRSWFIIGVNSGRTKNGRPDETATSHLGIRWFRDGKEVQNANLPLELTTISAEALLRLIIQRHAHHIFSNIYSKLRTKPLYKNKDLALSFRKSLTTGEPELNVQLNQHDKIKITIETVSGKIAMSPASRTVMQAEWKLNMESKDPAQNGHVYIENLRCHSSSEAIMRKSISVGWQPVNNPGLMQEMLKPIVPRDTLQLRWFRRPGWEKDWYAVLSSSMSGDRWLLIEVYVYYVYPLTITNVS